MSTTLAPLTGAVAHDQPRLDRAAKQATVKSTLECLIVSTNTRRRELLSRAAADNGWTTVVCGDANSARHLASRIALKLAIVDVERPAPSIENVVEREAFATRFADLDAKPDHLIVHEHRRFPAIRRAFCREA